MGATKIKNAKINLKFKIKIKIKNKKINLRNENFINIF